MLVEAVLFVLLAWLLTYLVHSTILLGATWLVTRRLVRSDRLRERLWKVAALGGLLTAALQVTTGWQPYGDFLALREQAPQAIETATVPEAHAQQPRLAFVDAVPEHVQRGEFAGVLHVRLFAPELVEDPSFAERPMHLAEDLTGGGAWLVHDPRGG